MKKKVSFDFDGTLSEKQGQRRAQSHINKGDVVYITTARPEKSDNPRYDNEDLFKVADDLGISRSRITFTAFDDKWKYVKNYDYHYDNDDVEITLINANTECIGILIKYEN